MRQQILDEIDEQHGLAFQGMGVRPYRWIGALTTYGVMRPVYHHRWLDANVRFLEQTLTPLAVHDTVGRAVTRLADLQERGIAAAMLADLPAREHLLAARCADLPALLATTQVSSLLQWSH